MSDVTFLQEKKYSLLYHIHCVLDTWSSLVIPMVWNKYKIDCRCRWYCQWVVVGVTFIIVDIKRIIINPIDPIEETIWVSWDDGIIRTDPREGFVCCQNRKRGLHRKYTKIVGRKPLENHGNLLQYCRAFQEYLSRRFPRCYFLLLRFFLRRLKSFLPEK